MTIKRNTLLLLACLVWSVAGWNVLRIGWMAYAPYRSVGNFLLSILVFSMFQVFVFGKLVRKHTTRICAYTEERKCFLCFFDSKSFVIMAIMMTGGVLIRVYHWMPEQWIAVFYSGLGASLLLAGILFGLHYLKVVSNQKKETEIKGNEG